MLLMRPRQRRSGADTEAIYNDFLGIYDFAMRVARVIIARPAGHG